MTIFFNRINYVIQITRRNPRTPILATYSATGNQLENGIDGFLCDTNTEFVYENLLSLYKSREKLEFCKKALINYDFHSINQKIISSI